MNFFPKFFAALISHQMEQRQKLERRMLHTKNELQSMKCGVSNLSVLLEARTKFIQTGLVDVSKEKIIENLCEIISTLHSNLDIANKYVIPFLFTISNNSLYQM